MKAFAPALIVIGVAFAAAACAPQDATAKKDAPAPAAPVAAVPEAATLKGPLTYATLKPYLQTHCFGCHSGPKKFAGTYDLASYAGVMKGGEDGVMIKPGDGEGSLLVHYLRGTAKPRMPAKSPPLPDGDIQAISDWIKDGAKEK